MLKALKLINDLYASASPNDYESVSYNRYFRDLSTISNTILEDVEIIKNKEIKILAEIYSLPDSSAKENIIKIIGDK